MTALSHDVSLRLGAAKVAVGAWDQLSITHDMLAPPSPWTVTLWRPSTAPPWPETDLWPLTVVDAPAEVVVDGAVQVRGFIARTEVSGARAGSPLTITGRDQAAQAQVSDADPSLSLRGVTLSDALARLFGPLGINITIGLRADDARPALAGMRPGAHPSSGRRARRAHRVDHFRVRPGEKVWQLAETLCRRHGFLLYTAPSADGVGLVIDRPAYDSEVVYEFTRTGARDGSWEGNILSGSRAVDVSQVPTSVTVFGHSAIAASQDARLRVTLENDGLAHPRVATSTPARHRYLRDDRARTRAVCEQRARRELANAMASFDVYTAQVQGFGQRGRLYAVNSMARVRDDLTGTTGDWLVTQVQMQRSRQGGHAATVRMIPKGSLVISPDPDA